jgi:hypothetical protein
MQRPIRQVPFAVMAVLALGIVLQISLGLTSPRPTARAHALPAAPPLATLRAASLGEPIAFSQLAALYLQAFDNQPGVSIPFRDLDYDRVTSWLTRILELDPAAQYPLVMASHLYAQVPDEAKQRQMLDFLYRAFLNDPNRRWQWLAHAAVVAKHRLHDLPLALKYAQAIARHARGADVPHWAQQMPIFILEDMGEVQSAKVLLGALLANGQISDPHEIYFLGQRLKALEKNAPAVPRTVDLSSPMSK